jgi:hypothetical protein
MMGRQRNTNFGNPMILCKPIVTRFESVTKKLGLETLEQQKESIELRTWVRRNMNQYYVPESLLEVWGESVDIRFDY